MNPILIVGLNGIREDNLEGVPFPLEREWLSIHFLEEHNTHLFVRGVKETVSSCVL